MGSAFSMFKLVRRAPRLAAAIAVISVAVAIVPVEHPVKATAQDTTKEPLRITLLTNGPLNDWGFNQSNDAGIKLLKARMGNRVRAQAIGEVPETGDAERIMRRLIQQRTRVIIAASYGYHDTTRKLAAEHPNVSFLQVFGPDHARNLGSYSVAMYQPWYVMGVVAGLTTRTNKLGVVVAHPVPPLKWFVNVYQMGARSVNPNVTTTVTYTNHWFDPNLAAQATEALIASQHDVVTGILDNMVAVAQTGERRGAWVISHSTDLRRFAPTRFLTGTEYRWGSLFVKIAEGVLREGLDRPIGDYAGGLAEGYVGISEFGPRVPQSVRQRGREALKRITADDKFLYRGPIVDNQGQVIVKEGEELPFIVATDWYLQGVRASN